MGFFISTIYSKKLQRANAQDVHSKCGRLCESIASNIKTLFVRNRRFLGFVSWRRGGEADVGMCVAASLLSSKKVMIKIFTLLILPSNNTGCF